MYLYYTERLAQSLLCFAYYSIYPWHNPMLKSIFSMVLFISLGIVQLNM